MRKLFLSLSFLLALGVQGVSAQTWEDAYAVPNMLGDGGLLQPNLLNNAIGGVWYNIQQHTTKICENNSVIPRDRIGFHFDALQDVQTGRANIPPAEPGGSNRTRNLQEYRFWGEKTFFNENISLDLIVPLYYSTDRFLDSLAEVNNPTPLDSQFGDLAFGLKALVWEDEDKAYSAGVRVEAPTAPDFIVDLGGQVEDRIDMDVWYFTPWIGGQWTPGPDWFASGFVSYQLNSGTMTRVSQRRGPNVFRQPTYLFVDLAIGRWIVQREGQGGLTSLAPVVELHYTTTPTNGTIDPGEDDYSSGELIGKTDYLNITGGFNGTINDDWQFGIGAALPLRTGLAQGPTGFEWNSDRTFSWALLANLNYYFR